MNHRRSRAAILAAPARHTQTVACRLPKEGLLSISFRSKFPRNRGPWPSFQLLHAKYPVIALTTISPFPHPRARKGPASELVPLHTEIVKEPGKQADGDRWREAREHGSGQRLRRWGRIRGNRPLPRCLAMDLLYERARVRVSLEWRRSKMGPFMTDWGSKMPPELCGSS
jgi:hypothetical protein